MKRAPTHARRREQTRARLVHAARTLFARRGVGNTRIKEITDEADVGFGSFYDHSESKAAIVEAVLMETVAERDIRRGVQCGRPERRRRGRAPAAAAASSESTIIVDKIISMVVRFRP